MPNQIFRKLTPLAQKVMENERRRMAPKFVGPMHFHPPKEQLERMNVARWNRA